MKTILLHVGTHKTGSTSLQSTFYQNRSCLEKLGVSYLGEARAYRHLNSAFMANPMNFEWNALSGMPEDDVRARDKAALDELTRLIKENPCETIIISNEYLSMLNHAELQNLKAFLEPHGRVIAVYYYRELLSWMSSDSQQLAKVGMRRQPTTFEIAIERIGKMPLRVSKVFGTDNSRFIRFEDAVKVGICDSFLSEFDLPTLGSQGISEVHANESISANAVRAMYVYNRLFPLGSGQRRRETIERLCTLDGAKYVLAGITKDQVHDYAEKTAKVVETLGFNLLDPNQIPVSDVLDPMAEELLKMINRHARLQQE